MIRKSMLMLGLFTSLAYTGCTHCDTCDDFPAPCTGPGCGGSPYPMNTAMNMPPDGHVMGQSAPRNQTGPGPGAASDAPTNGGQPQVSPPADDSRSPLGGSAAGDAPGEMPAGTGDQPK